MLQFVQNERIMKAKILILPDAKASFVSYLKRQRALCQHQWAKTSRKVATSATPAEENRCKTSDGLTDAPHVREICVESSAPARGAE